MRFEITAEKLAPLPSGVTEQSVTFIVHDKQAAREMFDTFLSSLNNLPEGPESGQASRRRVKL